MTLTAWIAIAVILVTVYCLIKRFETRLVLFTAGLFLCCIAMNRWQHSISLPKHGKRFAHHGDLFLYGLCLCGNDHRMRIKNLVQNF